ncbi:uncharacterized protein LOC111125943 [Crassostrea virginica]|nr:uncharacterized protein LOC111125943 isoform X2 [Crassostrea virginica]
MSTLESSGPNIKFSEEFRQTVYKINPDYLSCTHKALFEVNATDNLRNQESDFQIVTNNSTERRKPFSDVNEFNAPSRSSSSITGTFSDSALKVLQNNCLSVDRRELRGWEVCIRSHSAQSYSFRKQRIDFMRDLQRGRSLSASINSTRREKFKVSKISVSSPGPLGYRCTQQDAVDTKGRKDDAHSSSSISINGYNHSTPGYFTTNPKPIVYKFKHFENASNYIEQYRNEYTYQYIYDQSNASSSSSCSCEVRGQAIPGKQPAYRWVDIPHTKECPRHRREGHAVSMSSSSGLTINSITCKTTRQSENFQQAPDRSRNQTPRYLLSHNGVVKMELYNSPLMIDTTKPDRAKATTISRARPIISSSPRAGLHPNSSVTAPSIRPSYQRKS